MEVEDTFGSIFYIYIVKELFLSLNLFYVQTTFDNLKLYT